MPVDTVPVDTVPVDTVPVDTVPIDTVAPPSSLPAEVDPAAAEVLVGLTEEAASVLAAENGWTLRVVRVDGEDLAVTEDWSPTRVNVATEAGVVVAVVNIG